MVTSSDVKRILKEAYPDPRQLSDVALAYISALGESEAMYGEEGVRVQCVYILVNLRARTPEQKEAKKKLKLIGDGRLM